MNFALTWDGRAATRSGGRSDFSSPADKRRMLELRAGADAVMVGRGTLEIERMKMGLNEALQARRMGEGKTPAPLRVVVSASGRLDPAAPLFHTEGAPVVIFSTAAMPDAVAVALAGKAELHLSPALDLREVLAVLHARHGVRRLLCEGGPGLLRSLLEAGFVDEINVTFCPRVFGGAEAPTLTGTGGGFLPGGVSLRLESLETMDGEAFARYRVNRS